ncbi:DNA-directed RNA polymerase I core subunit rpa12 [Coemansia sp. RSA 1813]|nr:DNA-directed RNA polymerase I core subunit rpa12 [Coemansia sp. RSA 1646]KAJ1768757.1 DNA-directed RNA polymerase I core subunit rpa12 [Coemansia sp. RSA 1843]KAJ2086709.1 DNA-directed RNA polymerase I core subunit rpa12 [Coemansia sp. RSA 986]KAJ2211544.1 DNA-directed RNA polymerase I core subunit rpa12 [Coemansia sp. RSA 487]KAJ2571609.1 DNA-directed RNA polymerase I core subunit rpa12 [Coemansia sp. RSA 1813]
MAAVSTTQNAETSTSGQRRANFGSLFFCPTCSNLLENPGDQDHIVCHACGDAQEGSQFEKIETVSRSQGNAFPSRLRNKRSLVQDVAETERMNATVDELCQKCGATEMTFQALQMRSADEGQTVFYKCVKCGYGFSVNN